MLLCFAQLKCGNCGEVSDKWQYVTLVVRGTTIHGTFLHIQCVYRPLGSSGECTVERRKRQCQHGAEM